MEKPRYCGECGGQYFFPKAGCTAWVCYACGCTETENGSIPRSPVNCEELLRKYILYVQMVEGETFIPEDTNDSFRYAHNPFSEAELAKLHELLPRNQQI